MTKKIKLEDLTEKDFADARLIYQDAVNSLTSPALPKLGLSLVLAISKDHWKGAKPLYTGLRDGLYTGLRDGLHAGLYTGLDAGLRDGLRNGLDDGLYTGLRDGLDDKNLRVSYCGIFWNRWFLWYLIAARFGCKLDMQKLGLLSAFCLYSPLIGSIKKGDHETPVVLPKPTKINWNITGKTESPFKFPIYELHADGEPSVVYPGLNLYHWHNTKIPERMGSIKSKHWDAAWVLDERNAEVRRILINEIGYERILTVTDAKKIDSYREYELLRINLPNFPVPQQVLKMTCPSTGHVHCLKVRPEETKAREAIKWCNWGIDPEAFVAEA